MSLCGSISFKILNVTSIVNALWFDCSLPQIAPYSYHLLAFVFKHVIINHFHLGLINSAAAAGKNLKHRDGNVSQSSVWVSNFKYPINSITVTFGTNINASEEEL